MDSYSILWTIFITISFTLFLLDLKFSVLNPHEISFKESLTLCSIWISIAILYSLCIWYYLGSFKMAEYLTAYIIEYSLSVDNMFVFLMIFSYFKIEKKYQPKILVIGILSAVVMRLIFIFAGIALVKKFSWVLYVFGIILVYTGIKMFFHKEENIEPEKNIILRLIKKYFRIAMNVRNGNFFIRENNKIIPTIMVAVLIVIETTDLIFAIDSIPAVLSISQDKLIVYSSNIFAIIGLRSLYFSLAALNEYFKYLKDGVSIVLIYVGIKMLISKFIHINPFISLGIVSIILFVSIIFSILKK
ncbi:MAG: TerC/Alx family metal homeostasis membrane protein [Elusimicrobiales bacterium]|nr:TerC/Alx family metal homeostasis membrane protein [Elusimicrobiales bacterium]